MNQQTTSLPNKAFDSEYSTQFKKEMLYLRECGIDPIFIKKVGEYRIPTYKYTKTPELFTACAAFYKQQRASKEFDSMIQNIDAVATIVNGAPESGVCIGCADH